MNTDQQSSSYSIRTVGWLRSWCWTCCIRWVCYGNCTHLTLVTLVSLLTAIIWYFRNVKDETVDNELMCLQTFNFGEGWVGCRQIYKPPATRKVKTASNERQLWLTLRKMPQQFSDMGETGDFIDFPVENHLWTLNFHGKCRIFQEHTTTQQHTVKYTNINYLNVSSGDAMT